MTEVKRSYRSQLRSAQALATRARVLEAAQELFNRWGYPATSIAAIARAGGVSPETIYKTFGTKRSILSELIDVSLVGDSGPEPLLEREIFIRVRRAGTQRERVARLAHLTRTVLERAGPIHRIIREAASVDPDAAAIRAEHQAARLKSTGVFVETLLELGPLRRGMTSEEAADLYWTVASPEVQDTMIRERGWSHDRYEAWLADAAAALLLEDG